MTDTRSRAFTLVNLLVSMAILAVVAGVAVVSLAPDDRARVLGAAEVLASDLEHAQALSLATPDDPVVVRIDVDNEGYWLERASEPDVALLRSNGSSHIVIFGQGDAAALAGVDVSIIEGAEAGVVAFDAFGRLAALENAVIRLSLRDEEAWLVASSSTGFVDVALDNPSPPAPPADPPAEEKGGGLLGGLLGR